jgi:hypothetical protein
MKTGSRCSDVISCEAIQLLNKSKNKKKHAAEWVDTSSGALEAPAAADESTGACYVCGRVLKEGLVYIGKGLYRHESCYPGSLRWINSAAGRASVLRSILFRDKKEDDL